MVPANGNEISFSHLQNFSRYYRTLSTQHSIWTHLCRHYTCSATCKNYAHVCSDKMFMRAQLFERFTWSPHEWTIFSASAGREWREWVSESLCKTKVVELSTYWLKSFIVTKLRTSWSYINQKSTLFVSLMNNQLFKMI